MYNYDPAVIPKDSEDLRSESRRVKDLRGTTICIRVIQG